MKYLCDGCGRLVDARLFRVDAGALVLTCDACGQESRNTPAPARPPEEPPAPRPALASTTAGSNVVELRPTARDGGERARTLAAEGPFVVPEGRCPKCISPRAAGALACGNCGADFARVSADGLMPDAWLQEAWIQLLGNWSDTSAHDVLALTTLERGDLPALGRLYRLFLAHAPDDALARRGRDEVVRRASGTALVATPSPDPEGTPTWKIVLTVLVGLATVGALFLFLSALWESRG